jgi:hypothetical protein
MIFDPSRLLLYYNTTIYGKSQVQRNNYYEKATRNQEARHFWLVWPEKDGQDACPPIQNVGSIRRKAQPPIPDPLSPIADPLSSIQGYSGVFFPMLF